MKLKLRNGHAAERWNMRSANPTSASKYDLQECNKTGAYHFCKHKNDILIYFIDNVHAFMDYLNVIISLVYHILNS